MTCCINFSAPSQAMYNAMSLHHRTHNIINYIHRQPGGGAGDLLQGAHVPNEYHRKLGIV